MLNHTREVQELNVFFQESRDRHFIGGIEDGRRISTLFQGSKGQGPPYRQLPKVT